MWGPISIICNNTLIRTVVLKRDKDNFSMVTFLKATGCDRQNITSVLKWTFDEDARDMVDEIAGIKRTNSSVVILP